MIAFPIYSSRNCDRTFLQAVRCIFIKKKHCRLCLVGRPKKHDCRLNFVGSSRAMEADMAKEIFLNNENFTAENVCLRTLIGDEDSLTIVNLRRESVYPIEKWTDINHVICKLSKYLYSLK